LSELQRSNPNGWVTWLAHRTVSGGAPDYPVRPSIDSLPNGHFGGWGYKGLFGWAVAVKKVAVGCELWKKLL
jgi:hypothetical protein